MVDDRYVLKRRIPLTRVRAWHPTIHGVRVFLSPGSRGGGGGGGGRGADDLVLTVGAGAGGPHVRFVSAMLLEYALTAARSNPPPKSIHAALTARGMAPREWLA